MTCESVVRDTGRPVDALADRRSVADVGDPEPRSPPASAPLTHNFPELLARQPHCLVTGGEQIVEFLSPALVVSDVRTASRVITMGVDPSMNTVSSRPSSPRVNRTKPSGSSTSVRSEVSRAIKSSSLLRAIIGTGRIARKGMSTHRKTRPCTRASAHVERAATIASAQSAPLNASPQRPAHANSAVNSSPLRIPMPAIAATPAARPPAASG
jgi:hypothetical protein